MLSVTGPWRLVLIHLQNKGRFIIFVGIILVLALCNVGFDVLRYYFELYYVGVKWHLMARCPASMETDSNNIVESSGWEELVLKQSQVKAPTKWVISKPHVGLGLCNRMLHSISLLMFAMASNRTLWIEWEEQEIEFITENEIAGMSGYDALFVSKLHDRNLRPPDDLMRNATLVRDCVLDTMRFSKDLEHAYHQPVIQIEGGDWLGPLLIQNNKTPFRAMDMKTGFPILFRALFTLHPPLVFPEKQCVWMIQYRAVWPPPRYTAPIDAFIACAERHGLLPQHFSASYIVTDDVTSMFESATTSRTRQILNLMNIPERKSSCRGPCGDRQSVETMYRFSSCKNFVLTHGSSYGSCTSSLSGSRSQFRVSQYGECIATEDGALDANSYSRNGGLVTYLSH